MCCWSRMPWGGPPAWTAAWRVGAYPLHLCAKCGAFGLREVSGERVMNEPVSYRLRVGQQLVASAALLCALAAGSGNDRGTALAGVSARTPLAAHTAGKPCTRDLDCPGGGCVVTLPGRYFGIANLVAHGGYCTTGCATDVECGVCSRVSLPATDDDTDAGLAAGICYARCASDADRRSSYRCTDHDGLALTPSSTASPPAPADPHPPAINWRMERSVAAASATTMVPESAAELPTHWPRHPRARPRCPAVTAAELA
jgi:hypothetical protein